MKKLIKKTIFYKIYRGLVVVKNRINILKYKSNGNEDYYCIGCNRNWKSFKPFPYVWFKMLKNAGWKYGLEEAETLNYINYTCYGCGINDRDRMYLLYFKKILTNEEKYNIVEFAPTPIVSAFFKEYDTITHRTADLFMEKADDKLDLQDLSLYKNDQFDIFICSHILEHVKDDIKAIKELYRITKKGGHGIAMVPILEGVEKTLEDTSIKNAKLRMKYFGQSDHVRLYSKIDFIKRLESVGFKVRLLDVNYFGSEVFDKNAITSKSVLYIVEKI